jgi:hypothetical protein
MNRYNLTDFDEEPVNAREVIFGMDTHFTSFSKFAVVDDVGSVTVVSVGSNQVEARAAAQKITAARDGWATSLHDVRCSGRLAEWLECDTGSVAITRCMDGEELFIDLRNDADRRRVARNLFLKRCLTGPFLEACASKDGRSIEVSFSVTFGDDDDDVGYAILPAISPGFRYSVPLDENTAAVKDINIDDHLESVFYEIWDASAAGWDKHLAYLRGRPRTLPDSAVRYGRNARIVQALSKGRRLTESQRGVLSILLKAWLVGESGLTIAELSSRLGAEGMHKEEVKSLVRGALISFAKRLNSISGYSGRCKDNFNSRLWASDVMFRNKYSTGGTLYYLTSSGAAAVAMVLGLYANR